MKFIVRIPDAVLDDLRAGEIVRVDIAEDDVSIALVSGRTVEELDRLADLAEEELGA